MHLADSPAPQKANVAQSTTLHRHTHTHTESVLAENSQHLKEDLQEHTWLEEAVQSGSIGCKLEQSFHTLCVASVTCLMQGSPACIVLSIDINACQESSKNKK